MNIPLNFNLLFVSYDIFCVFSGMYQFILMGVKEIQGGKNSETLESGYTQVRVCIDIEPTLL